MKSPSSMTIDSTAAEPTTTTASEKEKENDVVVVLRNSRKRSSAAISHRSSGAVVTPPRPSSPPLIDIINIETGGLTETEHLLFLHGPELHRKGSSAALLDLINIDDCDVVNKLVDTFFFVWKNKTAMIWKNKLSATMTNFLSLIL